MKTRYKAYVFNDYYMIGFSGSNLNNNKESAKGELKNWLRLILDHQVSSSLDDLEHWLFSTQERMFVVKSNKTALRLIAITTNPIEIFSTKIRNHPSTYSIFTSMVAYTLLKKVKVWTNISLLAWLIVEHVQNKWRLLPNYLKHPVQV